MNNQEERLVNLGDAAEQFLNHPAFVEVVNTLAEQNFQNFITSAPSETEKRENVYHQHRSLSDVVGTLRQWVSVRDEIYAKLNDDNRQEEG